MTRAAQWRPGPHDAVTDVPGVHVGHVTLDDGADIHTGVTAIVPAGICPGSPLPAGFFSGNGRGKFIGSTQVEELGELESPIVLTGTLSAFRAADALVSWMLADPRHHDVLSFNPVVGECNDGRLSDIRARPVTEAHVLHAIAAAGPGPIEQGSVGAGTGMVALGYKAGIGTAARTGELGGRPCTVGVLALANFGGRLRLAGGAPAAGGRLRLDGREPVAEGADDRRDNGSCVLVVATDAPLDARQLARVARRAVFGMARVGSSYGHESGDYAIAFTVSTEGAVPDAALSPLFEATLDATEAALIGSLLAARPMTGRGNSVPALRLE
ncbi:P1 family peptidase [Kribbella sp. NBC_00709]|uniref:P1 family peptidase n=1 Tax=Kribbella sp. NBC_00709 TaxID=2975972 RepID=UPI002E284364|nr:P1 family peptidase [Kribbella sp. NBC_00709]